MSHSHPAPLEGRMDTGDVKDSTSMMRMKKPHNGVMVTDHNELRHAAGKLSDTVCCVYVQGPFTPKRCIHGHLKTVHFPK